MIKTLGITHDFLIETDIPLSELQKDRFFWYWVDFEHPTLDESHHLHAFFHFHELAIEDCLYHLQRPKLDHYGDYQFLVLHSLNKQTLLAEELDLFLGKNFLVTFHHQPLKEVENTWKELKSNQELLEDGALGASHLLIDMLVDAYFPILYEFEDRLNTLEDNEQEATSNQIMEQVFSIRSDLIHLRKTIFPMRDLLYRMLNSTAIHNFQGHKEYFNDIYDHLLKLSEMIEANRELTADLRDSHISLNANRMNTIMMTLTVITTIFMPLTLIVGIYGMNFRYMPELSWKYGYAFVLSFMTLLSVFMYRWFKKKGWF